MSTPGCPSNDQLTAYVQGRLPTAEAEDLEAHVAVCPKCEAKLETDDELRRIVAEAYREDSPADDHLIAESEFRRAVEALEQLPGGPPADATRDYPNSEPQVGQIIAGRYKLLEQIGEGGMGSVYMAQQEAPVKRLVAVKVIIPGMDSRTVLARFEAERQALAMMDHPNIARVLDAGAMENGRPFFVMELVKGIPITRFCDERRLTLRQRLELFVPVCQAIQHAHQKGIIHRDIKPSNVLVAMYDDRPVPKVIDFGLAKATGQALTDKTLVTAFGAQPGTVLYMSPEQASPNNLDIDTRSDVFALGVLLYELLTGGTPLDRDAVKRAAALEALRMVREEEPLRPSAKLSSSEALPSIAANRNIEPARLTRLVQGELDWVALKALEKDRTRRYETANALARDVQRDLADEIVEARPPSTIYRVRKFVRRHKVQVIAAGLVFLALLAGISGTTFGLIRAEQQRRIAQRRGDSEARAKIDAEAKRIEAEKQQHRAEAGETLAGERLIQVKAEKTKVEEEKQRAEKQLFRSEWLLYASQIGSAQRDWETNKFAQAWKHLNATRQDFRGWEYNYLYTLFTKSQQTFRGHALSVQGVAFSPDGKRIVSGSLDMTLKVWDATSGQNRLTLNGHTGAVTSVAFSPDGKRIVSGSLDMTLKVWDATSGQNRLTLNGHTGAVTSVAFSPDGKRIVSGSVDETLKVWDATSGQERLTLRGHRGTVSSVAFSPDGTRIVSGNLNDSPKVWDATSGQETLTLKWRDHDCGAPTL